MRSSLANLFEILTVFTCYLASELSQWQTRAMRKRVNTQTVRNMFTTTTEDLSKFISSNALLGVDIDACESSSLICIAIKTSSILIHTYIPTYLVRSLKKVQMLHRKLRKLQKYVPSLRLYIDGGVTIFPPFCFYFLLLNFQQTKFTNVS